MILTLTPDVEDLARAWILTTAVAPLVANKVFLAMPRGAPMPSILMHRVGGAPNNRSDVSEDVARISFQCFANDRNSAKEIAKTLVTEAVNLAYTTGFVSEANGGRLHVAETLSWIWLPDPVSDKPRYVVDILFIATSLS